MRTISNKRAMIAAAGVAVIITGALTGSALAAGTDDAATAQHAINDGKAKNVILFLGDGMGDSEITIARNYSQGANGRLAMDGLPMTGAYTTYSVDKNGKVNYVTESAASATGWATGSKTYNGAISVNAADQDMPTILEVAQKAGFKTGDVTTAELTDATPAVLAAHVPDRTCQGPANMATCPQDKRENGGPGSIAEQMVDHNVDVLLGGGRARFAQTTTGGPYAGRTVLQQAQSLGYTIVGNDAELGATLPDQKVLGLFNDSNMVTVWNGPVAQPYTSDTAPNTTGDGKECVTTNAPSTQPTLENMTRKALWLLDAKVQNSKAPGFFLQVEGASIDKQDHASNPCAQIGETVDFDNAIRLGLDFAKTHPDTLIVVTADHAHTSQIVDFPQTFPHHSPGAFQTLLTTDGSQMVVNYATVTAPNSQDHTGSQVRIAAQGPQAFRVLGVTNQTDLFTTFKKALALN